MNKTPQKADLFIYLQIDDNSFLKPKMRHLIKFLTRLGATILKVKVTRGKENKL